MDCGSLIFMKISNIIKVALLFLTVVTSIAIFILVTTYCSVNFYHSDKELRETRNLMTAIGVSDLLMEIKNNYVATTKWPENPNDIFIILKGDKFHDSYGSLLKITLNNDSVTISSAGADQKFQTNDDISILYVKDVDSFQLIGKDKKELRNNMIASGIEID